ncbi:MAG: EH signature domain-containing protein, partial [Bacteroidales bacterium]
PESGVPYTHQCRRKNSGTYTGGQIIPMKALEILQDLKTLAPYPKQTYKIEMEAERILKQSIKEIDGLVQSLPISKTQEAVDDIEEALKEFWLANQQGISAVLSLSPKTLKRVLSGLVYYFDQFLSNPGARNNLSQALRHTLRGIYTRPLLKVLLEKWSTLKQKDPEYLDTLCILCRRSLTEGKTKIKLFLYFKNHLDLLRRDIGPIQIVAEMGLHVQDMFKYLEDLGFSPYIIYNYEFFEEIVLYYHERLYNKKHTIQEPYTQQLLNDYLPNFSEKVQVIVLSFLIKQLEEFSQAVADQIISYALRQFGDPLVSYKWSVTENKYKKYEPYLEEAKKHVLSRLNKEILTLFFQNLAGDKERKDFWLYYLKSFLDIKIAATMEEKTRILSNTSLADKKDIIDARFIPIYFGPPVILIRVDERIIVEFSELGNATYVYFVNNRKIKWFLDDSNKYRRSYKLKDTSVSTLTYQTMTSPYKEKEFRVIHNSLHRGWQTFYKKWLAELIGLT